MTDLLRSAEQLESVAPRVRRVEAADARKRVVPFDPLTRGLEAACEFVELPGRQAERGVRLARRRERLLDTDMELAAAEREPGTAAGTQLLRLLQLLQAEQVAEEAPRLVLAARRCRELNVI